LLASFIVFLVFFMVSFVVVSIIVIMSLRTVMGSGGGGWHAQCVGDAWASRAAEAASALQSAFVPDVQAASRPTVGQWPVTRAAIQAFDV
jgi:hypothetical protein